nr:PP2C family protein-serine/threonine phosphatase [Streptomyces sp. TRM64462]
MEDAVASIGTTLDARTTVAELAGYLCEHLCDTAVVDLFAPYASPESYEAYEQPGPPGPPGPPAPPRPPRTGDALVTVASAGRRDLLDRGVPRGRLSVRALDEGHPITASYVSSHAPPLAAVSVPLLTRRDDVYGVVLALRTGTAFTDDETVVAHFAARLAAAHLRHAAAHRETRDAALDLQRALLAEPGRPHPNLDIATRYLPSGDGSLVGGDWFETVRLHYGRTLLVIGDVMGHGLEAAVDMNAYRSMLRYVAATDLPPHRVLRHLDAAVCEDGTRRPATCLLVRLDPARSTAACASAGHLPPVLFTPEGAGRLLSVPVGPPLGTGIGGYELSTHRLTTDQTLLMFTDGLVERRGEDIEDSLDRLAALRLPGLGVRELLDEVVLRLGAAHGEDDVAVLAARTHHRPPAHHAEPSG